MSRKKYKGVTGFDKVKSLYMSASCANLG